MKRLMTIFAVAVCGFASVAVGLPTEVWVDDDWAGYSAGQAVEGHVFGTDAFATVADGVAGVEAGGTVNVAAGVYTQRLNINKSLTLLGAQAGVDPTSAGVRVDLAVESIITEAGLSTPNPDVLIDIANGVTNVTIDGFTLNGDQTNSTADTCVVRCASSGSVSDVLIANNVMDGRDGVLLKTGDNVQVASNRMTVNRTAVVCQYAGSGLAISGNAFIPGASLVSDAKAIYLTGVNGGTIADNTADGFPWDALAGSNLTNLAVSGNTFTNCRKGVSFWGVTTFINIANNTFSGMWSHGIDIKGADLAITGNTLTGNTGNGLTIDYHGNTTERVAVHENVIAGNGGYGLEVTAAVTDTVQAQRNWWGAVDGPAPTGTGDGVTGDAVYDPWYADAAMTTLSTAKPVLNVTQGTAHDTIGEAVAAATGGDTIEVAAGTYTLSATVNVNKANLTIIGAGSGATIFEVTKATGSAFGLTAAGATLRDLQIVKTDKAGVQNLIYIGADNVSILDNVIRGQWTMGDGDVSRAMEIAYGSENLTIEGNTIYGLRQPAYMNGSLASPTTGSIRNNHVYGTRGWVVDGADMTFTGNTWGTGSQANAVDIAILSATPPAYYTDIATISAANSNAVIEDQRVSPAVLSVVYVDAAAPAGGDGTSLNPYQTMAEGVARVAAGGTVHAAAGTYVEELDIAKDLTLVGAGPDTVIQSPAVLTNVFGASANNKPVVYVHDADNVVIRNLTLDGNGQGNSNNRFMGIAYHNAGGAVEQCVVRNVKDTPFSGAQHGIGIGAFNTDGAARSFSIVGCDAYDIQKTALYAHGTGLTVDIRNNTVLGVGPTAVTAQNGIQVGQGATGSVTGNRCWGFYYTGPGWAASAIMSFGDNVALSGNNVSLSNFGLYVDSAVGGSVNNNAITGNDWGLVSNSSAAVDATDNWWGMPAGAGWLGSAHGDFAYDYHASMLDVSSPAAKPDPAAFPNVVYLQPTDESVYVKTTDTVLVDLKVANLQEKVAGLQAMLHFSSTHFSADAADVSVAPGGSDVWDSPIWFVAGDPAYPGSGVPGDIDTVVVVNQYAPMGTDEDAKVAIIGLKPIAEGVTQLVFREDDPVLDTKQTFFGSMANPNEPIWPSKINSTNIYIDGTAPTIGNLTATQSGNDVLDGAGVTIQGVVTITVDATDNLAGWDTYPEVTVTQGAASLPVTFVEQAGETYTYTTEVLASTANGTWTITATATDKAGNAASVGGTLEVNKTQVSGTVSFSSVNSSTAYSVDRTVTFVATDAGGAVLKTWMPTVCFANDPGSQTASGSYVLTNVPAGVVNLSAKTAWHLRSRQAVTFDGDDQADGVAFTLLGGDVNGTNSINVLDYSVLKVNWNSTNAAADINGDGIVNILDYSLMKQNWFRVGDPQ